MIDLSRKHRRISCYLNLLINRVFDLYIYAYALCVNYYVAYILCGRRNCYELFLLNWQNDWLDGGFIISRIQPSSEA